MGAEVGHPDSDLRAGVIAGSASPDLPLTKGRLRDVWKYTWRAVILVWTTHRGLAATIGLLMVATGVLPAGIAYLGKLIVDSVVAAIDVYQEGGPADYGAVLSFVAFEAALVMALAATQRAIGFCRSLLNILLTHRLHVLIVEKALTLSLAQFEDSEFYDKLNRARQQSATRPLSLMNRLLSLGQSAITIAACAGLLLQFSPWSAAILVVAGLPTFLGATKFSSERFQVFNWRSKELRMMVYLESVLGREDFAKEVQLFRIGPLLLNRCRDIFNRLYKDEKRLASRSEGIGFLLSLVSTAAFYSIYAWIAVSAIRGSITLGDVTMYLLIFRQAQSAVGAILAAIGGMYEDTLYLSNLYDYLEQPGSGFVGNATTGQDPAAGLEFDHVTFTYPGTEHPAVSDVTLHLRPGQSVAVVGPNGSGKTTLVKLLAGLYRPSNGTVRYLGTDLGDWDAGTYRSRVGAIFQDFNRYQLTAGENIGVGDVDAIGNRERLIDAAKRGSADSFIENLPRAYDSQLGLWFENGQELSGGQWQRIALARAFMRSKAEIVVLDEPTAAMDAAKEEEIFEPFHAFTKDKIAVLVSHRFSTVRRASVIIVMDKGRIVERGSHDELMASNGGYARLFKLQARAYR